MNPTLFVLTNIAICFLMIKFFIFQGERFEKKWQNIERAWYRIIEKENGQRGEDWGLPL